MKPCSQNRKLIAWLAVDALEARDALALRDHLVRCAGCRRYWEEMSNVTERLAAAAPESGLEAGEGFHRRVARKLRQAEASPLPGNPGQPLRGLLLSWRVAGPGLAVLAVALLTIVASRDHEPGFAPTHPTAQIVTSGSGSDLAPTLANYRMAASQSVEKLDELLTREGNKPLPPAPMLTASGLALASAPF